MKVTRKQFLSVLLAGAATALARPLSLLGAPSGPVAFSPALFLDQVGSSFFLALAGGGTAELLLDDVTSLPSGPETVQFSLQLVSATGAVLPEGTYAVEHPGIAIRALYIAPAGNRPGGKTVYRADFCLLVRKVKDPQGRVVGP